MFEKFADYMYYLLTTPLKKTKKSINQFYIFFRVVGSVFDDLKSDFYRICDETNIITASNKMLKLYGNERVQPMLYGEDIEDYRRRLSMRAIIAANAGTKEGIILAVKSLGYESVIYIEMYKLDLDRWAEFLIIIRQGIDDPRTINLPMIKSEVRKVKEASALDNYSKNYYLEVKVPEKIDYSITHRLFYQFEVKNVVRNIIRFDTPVIAPPTSNVILSRDAWFFDGTYTFDGSMTASAYYSKEEL